MDRERKRRHSGGVFDAPGKPTSCCRLEHTVYTQIVKGMMYSTQTRIHLFPPAPLAWAGAGPDPPGTVYALIEITPFDLVKYRLNRETGSMVSPLPTRRCTCSSPAPTAMKPWTPFARCPRSVLDPLDIYLLSECSINRGGVPLRALIVGGLPKQSSSFKVPCL